MDASLAPVRLLVVSALLCLPVPARGNPAEDLGHERFLDGEIDREDMLLGHTERGQSWLTLAGFTRVYDVGPREVGAMAILGLALDRVGARAHPALSRVPPLSQLTLVPALDVSEAARTPPRIPVTPVVARRAVAAAWRAAGLGTDDGRLDAMVARARWSTLLPETRLRAMRRFDESLNPDQPAV